MADGRALIRQDWPDFFLVMDAEFIGTYGTDGRGRRRVHWTTVGLEWSWTLSLPGPDWSEDMVADVVSGPERPQFWA